MIYFDNSATTSIKPEVKAAMDPYFEKSFYNPSSPYSAAHKVNEDVWGARMMISQTLHCNVEEIYFCGSGSEADNWAIKGVVSASDKKLPHIITTEIEHHAILYTCQQLEETGQAKITYVPVSSDGIIDVNDIEKAITKDTVLVSVMHTNNEIGTVQPVCEIGMMCRQKGISFHTDAVQAYGKVRIDTSIMNVDLISVSGHKIHGPKGSGFLYIRNGTKILPLINGGQQEFNLRAGTENVPYIIGLAKAAELAYEEENTTKELREYLYSTLSQKFPEIKYNGNQIRVAPQIINICFVKYGIKGEELVAFYDQFDIYVSSGSACNSKSNEPSHVLKAIGLSDDEANSSIRISLSNDNTKEEVDKFIYVTEQAIYILGGRTHEIHD